MQDFFPSNKKIFNYKRSIKKVDAHQSFLKRDKLMTSDQLIEHPVGGQKGSSLPP